MRCGKCKVIAHKVFHILGEPAIAVSDFSDGIRKRENPRFNSVEYIVNWGMTVLPLNKGHKVIFHHLVEEESIIEPMSQYLSHLHAGPFHSLVIPAQAGIYIVLPQESCHRPL